MANKTFQLNYDEMITIAKKFKDEGEDIARLHSDTRQRVRDLYKEWVGEGADKFFEEMETKLLPALQRLSLALFHTQDVSNELMKIIQSADEETAGYFKDQLAGDDFGAGRFGAALNDVQGGTGADDFGAGTFGEALGTPSNAGSSSADDFGAGKFGEVTTGDSNDSGSGDSHETSSSQGGGQDSSEQRQKDEKEETPPETEPTSSGGGGGSSNQGLQGDLKKMGTGLSDVAAQDAQSGVGSGAGGSTNMPDHIYSSDASNAGGEQTSPPPSGGGDADQPAPGGGAAAGVAGSVGAAAAGGAAKLIKDQKNKTSE